MKDRKAWHTGLWSHRVGYDLVTEEQSQKTVMEVTKKLNMNCNIIQHATPEIYHSKEMKSVTKRYLSSHDHGSIFHNSQEMETSYVHQQKNS